MISAMEQELKMRADYLKHEPIKTLYFGGGTPSLLTSAELKGLIAAVQQHYQITSDVEFTLEANPDDINRTALETWKELGINRLSIGVQSFLQDDLDWMNRAHSAKESVEAVQMAKDFGFTLTVDLMYGLPYRNVDDWEKNIAQLVALSPQHISAYCLTIEKGTHLDQMINKGEIIAASEDEQANQFIKLLDKLNDAGYEQYEISNFARNEQYSKHNSNYWKGVSYIGIGPSAHSFDGKSRQWNVSNNPQYMKKILGGEPYFVREELSPKDQFNELLLTGLRTKWGVAFHDLMTLHTIPSEFYQKVELFVHDQLMHNVNNQLVLTNKGKLQADYITSLLFLDE